MRKKLMTHRERIGRTRSPDDRPSSARRGYDARWRKLRLWFLGRHPFCRVCEEHGVIEPATEADHIVPIRVGGARLDVRNLQALCKSCHSRKTARECVEVGGTVEEGGPVEVGGPVELGELGGQWGSGGPGGPGGGRKIHREPGVTGGNPDVSSFTGFGGKK